MMQPIDTTVRPARWRLPAHPGAPDVLLAVPLGVAISLGSIAAARLQDAARPLDGVAFLLIIAAAGSLAWWRAAPMGALAGALLAVGAYLLVGYPFGPIQLCMVLAMLAVASRRPLRASAIACGLAIVAAVGTALPRLADGAAQPLILTLAWTGWLIVPWALGALTQVRAVAAERQRRDLIARATLEERVWIAREVHDAAGHGLSAIAMQAGVALLVLDERPDQARASLEAIRTTSIQALDELRTILGALHAATPRMVTVADDGALDLNGLADRVRAAGLAVDLDLAAAPAAMPREVAVAVYRVAQEALTNTLRHAGPTRASVRVACDAGAVIVEVVDRGLGCSEQIATTGRGLTGLRARVEAAGGSFSAGPRDDGGFRVVARLPLPDAP